MSRNIGSKSLLVSIFLACGLPVQAAHFELTAYSGFAGYNGVTNGQLFSDEAVDYSSGAEIGLLGANDGFVSSLTHGQLNHGYAGDAYYSNGALSLSVSHFLAASVDAPDVLGHHYLETSAAFNPMTFRIVGDGEADGSNVKVNFSGFANSVYAATAGVSGSLSFDFRILQGDTQLGAFSWNGVVSDGMSNIDLSVDARVGDEISVYAAVFSRLLLDDYALTPSADALQIASIGGMLNGDLNVAVVPEPEQYAMMLAGLGLLGTIARRRRFS